jgi:glycosyltransferase involved in cell wall biosynthesis
VAAPLSAPLVSVITIFLDEERYLEEAIGSVLAQSFGDWELLLVDDGSTDASTELARRYAGQHPERVRYLEHPGHANRGMSASRNLGLEHARGRYVSYLDGDDVWLPTKLEEQVELLEAHPEAMMVFGPLEIWQSWDGSGDDYQYGLRPGERHPFADRLVHPPELLCLFLEREDLVPGGVLLERAVLERTGGSEDEFRNAYEDAVIHTKICLRWPVYVAGRSWYRYRQHPRSYSKLANARGPLDEGREAFVNWVESYLRREGVDDPRIWRSLERALRPYRQPLRHRLELARQRVASRDTWSRVARAVAQRTAGRIAPGRPVASTTRAAEATAERAPAHPPGSSAATPPKPGGRS